MLTPGPVCLRNSHTHTFVRNHEFRRHGPRRSAGLREDAAAPCRWDQILPMDAERETLVSGINRKHSPSALSTSQGTNYPISWSWSGYNKHKSHKYQSVCLTALDIKSQPSDVL